MQGLSLRTVTPVMLLASGMLLVAMAGLSLLTFSLLNREVAPALQENARVIGQSVGDRIERAVSLGIPLDKLVGVEGFLDEVMGDAAGISALALSDAEGRVLYAAGQASGMDAGAMAAAREGADGAARLEGWPRIEREARQLFDFLRTDASRNTVEFLELPLEQDGRRIGTVHVGTDRLFIARQLQNTAIDILIVIGVALLLAFEALLLVVSVSVNGPLTQIAVLSRRLARRDFSRRARSMGARAVRRVIDKANRTLDNLEETAAGLRRRIEALPGSRQDLMDKLAAIGRFSGSKGPKRLPSGQLIGARGAAFLFVLAEELARPFLPLFFRGFAEEGGMLDPAVAIAVPISAFMLFTALAGPVAAAWSDRVGRRNSFLAGAALSTVGLAGTALSSGFIELTCWRSLSGVGYALTFVACQGHVLDRTNEADRARGFSIFVGGIFAADICGPAIGGILADLVGYVATLLTSAGIAAVSTVLAIQLMDNRPRVADEARRVFAGFGSVPECARNPRFLAVVILAAIPAKMLLTGFLFYLAPLILSDLGASDSEIGRLAMIYGISALLLMPLFATLCDRLKAHGFMVGAGALISGVGLLPLVFGAEVWTIAVAILALGVGQSMSISAQTALISIVGRRQIAVDGPGPVFGVFRLVERIGAALGPLVAAQLAHPYGFEAAAYLFGFAAVVAGTLFSSFFLSVGVEPEPPLDAVEDGAEASP
jgi:predicted MFS family arabinose efflux permease